MINLKGKGNLLDQDYINLEINDVSDDYNFKLPSISSIREHKAYSKREVYINFEIDDSLFDVAMDIINWNKEDELNNVPIEERVPIKIFINSDGGELAVTLNLIDVIAKSVTPVWTIGMSRCYSSAGLLLISGHKRFAFPHTTALIHDGFTGDFNSIGKVQDRFNFSNRLEKKVKDFVINSTKINEKTYDEKYRYEWYFFADEMIEFGLIDKIINTLEEI